MEDRRLEKNCDIVVVGAGHAGCEAALACARLGLDTVMFTVSVDSIALMPCNPNVGGSSKGHLVRELDALGGEMGKNIDKTFIQSKMLNQSKGPAVHSLRAQADKQAYSTEMRKTLENQPNLTIKQGEVTKLLVEDGKITGVKLYSGAVYHCQAVVLCTGTYLKARCIYGDVSNYTGPNGLQAANYLTDSLKELGIDFDMTIISAHREPEEFFAYAKGAEEKGYKVIIAGAGKAAHLPGMCAAIFPMPVIGIPMKTSDLGGVDSLYSIVQMPTGIPVATVAINGAANAGILAAKMLATSDPELLERLKAYSEKLKNQVVAKADKLEEIGYEEYLKQM